MVADSWCQHFIRISHKNCKAYRQTGRHRIVCWHHITLASEMTQLRKTPLIQTHQKLHLELYKAAIYSCHSEITSIQDCRTNELTLILGAQNLGGLSSEKSDMVCWVFHLSSLPSGWVPEQNHQTSPIYNARSQLLSMLMDLKCRCNGLKGVMSSDDCSAWSYNGQGPQDHFIELGAPNGANTANNVPAFLDDNDPKHTVHLILCYQEYWSCFEGKGWSCS